MGLKAAFAALILVLLVVAFPAVANAEGEAGVVVEWGDGSVSALCVAFDGDSISGDQLLARAGLIASDFTGMVCSINSVGCQHSGTFDSCTCECPVGSSECTYWAFYTQRYGGAWVYSPLGFRSQVARDGDLHAWRWGERSPGSSSAPRSTTFEQVCGHSPGQSASTATPAPTLTPTATPPLPASTIPPAATSTATASVQSATPTSQSTTPVETSTAAAATPTPPSATETPTGAIATPTTPPLVTVAPPTPAPPAAGSEGSGRGFVAFGAIAAALVLGIGAALFWRRGHGA